MTKVNIQATVYKYCINAEPLYREDTNELCRYIIFHELEVINKDSDKKEYLYGYFPKKCSNAYGKKLNALKLNSGDVIRFKADLKYTKNGKTKLSNWSNIKVISRVETANEGEYKTNPCSFSYLDEFDYSTILSDDDVFRAYCKHPIYSVELTIGNAFLELITE